nr:MAG TPA: hypothetical protein [Caudoviricetes sp.]
MQSINLLVTSFYYPLIIIQIPVRCPFLLNLV